MPISAPTLNSTAPLPVAVQYVVTFLKPEMLHLYRQITSIRTFRPVVFCQKRENTQAFPYDDVRILPKPRTHALRRFWQKQLLGRPITIYAGEASRIQRALDEEQASVLHVYFGHIGVHLLPLLETCSLPVIVSFHGADAGVDLDQPAHLAPTRRMLEKATLLLARSASLVERLIALGADRSKIRLHRTGIPLAEIPFQQRSVPPDGAWHCLQVCRLIPKKGLPVALRAFAEFTRAFPAAKFTIAGEGSQLAELRALADDLKIADRVFFPGFLSQSDLRTLHTEAHLFLHPSELGPDGNQEGVPNAMLEAMASGLPVVATQHGGIPEAVEHGVSGLLSPEKDAPALAQSLFQLAGDSDLYARMSAAAAARVAAEFELTHQARVLENHYREAIEIIRRRKTS